MTNRRTVLFGVLAVAAGGAALAASATHAGAQPLPTSRLTQPNVSSNFRSSYLQPRTGLTNPGVTRQEPFLKESGPSWVNSPRHVGQGQLATNPALGANVQQSFQRNLVGR